MACYYHYKGKQFNSVDELKSFLRDETIKSLNNSMPSFPAVEYMSPKTRYDLNSVADRFSNEIENYDGTSNLVSDLGRPSEILETSGLNPQGLIRLNQRWFEKNIVRNKGITRNDISDLVRGIHNPIAVYDNTNQGRVEVVTPIQKGNDNLMVVLENFGNGVRVVDMFFGNPLNRIVQANDSNRMKFLNADKLNERIKDGKLDFGREQSSVVDLTSQTPSDAKVSNFSEFSNFSQNSVSEVVIEKTFEDRKFEVQSVQSAFDNNIKIEDFGEDAFISERINECHG